MSMTRRKNMTANRVTQIELRVASSFFRELSKRVSSEYHMKGGAYPACKVYQVVD